MTRSRVKMERRDRSSQGTLEKETSGWLFSVGRPDGGVFFNLRFTMDISSPSR
jgi:hypothetical protein